MKPYVLVVITLFLLLCLFKFGVFFAVADFNTANKIAEVLKVLFVLSLFAIIIKLLFRKGTKKLNV